ncbi:hypothetical protein [Aquabacterium sp.]|uniref:hypothetical protein n=1 Tax=Aquabacterium sp. TaxID=1872578 RepID=UPI00198DDFE3|nr:hypothetical protein [Aquabacterium sp.]MBC7699137.1 hypothetical protein [Aquabacterium sp.]
MNQEIEADRNRFAKLVQGQPAAGLQNTDDDPDEGSGQHVGLDVGADVLGPAYAMSHPS